MKRTLTAKRGQFCFTTWLKSSVITEQDSKNDCNFLNRSLYKVKKYLAGITTATELKAKFLTITNKNRKTQIKLEKNADRFFKAY